MAIAIAPNYTVRTYRWTEWKTIHSAKNLIHQYDDDGIIYTIWGYDGPEAHVCTIYKGEVPYSAVDHGYSQSQNNSDKSDFETNYMSTANASIGLTKLFGDTTDIKIGNTGDRLKVDNSNGAADKAAFTEGTSVFTPVGGVRNDTLAGDVAEDTGAAARITAKRALHANLRDNTGAELGTAANPLSVGVVSDTTNTGREKALEYSSYSPDTTSYPLGTSDVSMDYSDQLMVRGQVLSDEGSFRDDFTGSSLYRTLSGTLNFKNNNTDLNGGTAFTTEAKFGQYIKKTSDSETLFTQIDFISSNSALVFVTPYQGSNANVSGVVSDWKTITPAGATITVASSILNIAPGTTNGNFCGITRQGDYLPYYLLGKLSISQRIANQTAQFGFMSDPTTPVNQAVFVFDGTDNTKVKCRSSSSSAASDTQETLVTLPSGTTAGYHSYKIDLTNTTAVFSIDNVIVAAHEDHIPGPYDSLSLNLNVKNTATVTATTFSADWVFFSNVDQLEVTSGFRGEPFRVTPADQPATYAAAATNLSPATLATDLLTISGSATKTIKIKKIGISATQTVGADVSIVLSKRSSANSGGTSSALTLVPFDSNNPAATSSIVSYTANPTSLGTAVGNIKSTKMYVPAVTAAPTILEFVFGDNNNQNVILRGATQFLAINLSGITLAGASFNINVEWTEE